MELDGNRPTDAEMWTYLVENGRHITNDAHKLPRNMQSAIIEVLQKNWDEEVVSRINIHDFGVIWSDEHYKKLATKLWSGPAADFFHIEILHLLKIYRLEGYWDVLLENATDQVRILFEPLRHVSVGDFREILLCDGTSKKYQINLSTLFWGKGEAQKFSSRREEFLSHLSFTEYKEAYNILATQPLKPEWNFPRIVKEITKYSKPAKKVMLHVALWYNPNLMEPHSRKAGKKPIHYHLEEYFRKLLPQDPDAEAWKSKAVALQKIVIDFTKANGKILKGKYMLETMRSNQPSEVYRGRFVKGTFWDRLARRIHLKMPEIPFQHPDLLPYNRPGDNLYHSDQGEALGIPSSTHPGGDGLPIVDLTTGDGALVAPEIEDLIGQEYGSDTSSSKELSDPEDRASSPAGHEQTSSASTPTNRRIRNVKDQRDPNGDKEMVDADPGFYDTFPISPPPGLMGLRKRKTPKGFTPGGRRQRKALKVKHKHTTVVDETATGPSVSASDISQTLENGRHSVHFFQEQVQQQNSSPSGSGPNPSPSTSANDRQQSPIGPIPTPRRRKMMTNLPDDMYDRPAPSVVESTTNRKESARLVSQPPTLTAPPAPMFGASQEVTPAITTEISQVGLPLSNEVRQAVQIMLDELVGKLDIQEQVEAIREQIILDELVGNLNMEEQVDTIKEQVDTIKEQAVADKLSIEEQVAAMKEKVDTDKLNMEEQVDTIKEQAVADKLNIEEQVTAMKEQVDTIKEQAIADKLNIEERVTAMKEQVDTDKLIMEKQVSAIKKQAGTDKLNIEGIERLVAVIKGQVRVMKGQVDANRLKMDEQVDAIKEQVGAMEKQINADKLDMKQQVGAMKNLVEANKLNMNEQANIMKDQVSAMKKWVIVKQLRMDENVNAMKEQADADKLNMKEQITTVEAQFASMKGEVEALKQQLAAIKSTGTLQATQSQVDEQRALEIVLKFLYKLNTGDQVIAFNAVRNEKIRSLFLMLPAGTREAWLLKEMKIGMDDRGVQVD